MSDTDFYQVLEVDQKASQDDIKQSFRKLAMKHHPDRGGDQNKFKEINSAYETLNDPKRRAEYDAFRRGGPQVRFTTNGFNFEDIFNRGPGFNPFSAFEEVFSQHRQPRNRDLNIRCVISLLDSFTGKDLETSFNMPSGKKQTVVISIPSGIQHGETIRYSGLGDDSISGCARGNLNITVMVEPNEYYTRKHDDLYAVIEISPIDAMIGCQRTVVHINGSKTTIDIPAGTESGLEYAISNQGFTNLKTNSRGRFVNVIKIKTPKIINTEVVNQLRFIDAVIKSS